uniref:Claudin n=1 Tax=Poecilia latipinna TaxID=48699 RepID=A0A3B3UMF2_9TELE
MASACFQIFGIFLTTIGFTGDIIICALPMWKVSAFVGNSIMTAQTFWEGLWMNCVVQSTGQMQCKFYASMLALPQELQAARALVVISIIVAFLGLLLAVTGGECTNCIEDDLAKSQVAIAAGVFFIVGGILCLIPVSWSANEIIKTFYNPDLPDAQKKSQKRELGASLYIGWGTAALLFIGGGLLCATCPPKEENDYNYRYSKARSVDINKQQYV